jgi:hypothetical protein
MRTGDLTQSLGTLPQETGFLTKGHLLARPIAMQEQASAAPSSRLCAGSVRAA